MLNPIKNLCIHQLFEQQVLETPDAVAITFDTQQLTYQELNEKANQLAHYLRNLGVGPDFLVGIYVNRSFEMVIGLLGILKAGGGYVPLDTTYPIERLQFMVENAKVSVLLTQSHLREILSTENLSVFCLDTDQDLIANQSTANPINQVSIDNLAYVIYTSGSTGKPKGVAMPHRPLVNLLDWQQRQSFAGLGSKTLQFTPVSFDVSFQEIFSTLTTGGTLILIYENDQRNPFTLLRYLRENAVERLFLPFVALRQLTEVAQEERDLPTSLKEVITAGEQLRITETIASWFSRLPDCTLYNHYGPTESHVVTSYTLTGSPETWPILPPIGQPIDETEIYILDSNLQPTGAGISGELYLGGVCLARGYLNSPDLTAERFIINPYSQQLGERLYKTGDLARYLPDGNIEYLGRIDQQVKIRGFRVEPGEVEAAIEKHPEVQQAVAITREMIPTEKRKSLLKDKRLVAYIVSNTKPTTMGSFAAPFARKLRQFLRSQLPDHMIPSAFIILNEFPLTPSGKVDRRALPIPKWSRMEEGIYVVPRTPLEIKLAEIWNQILGVDQIGIHDNFYELGGYSLLTIQLVTELNKEFELNIPLESFLKTPTIIGLVKIIEALRQTPTVAQSNDTLKVTAELDPSIYPETTLSEPIPEIFLTGATGTLGTSLLYKLLNQTRADIYCLVRASNLEEARAKIQNNLKRYLFWNEDLSNRIFPLLGDLSQPYLGLAPGQFSRLAEKIDIIYHCAAWVNMIYPYSILKAANVLGTQEVLRLASQTKIKPVHFVSTVDVFSLAKDDEIRTVMEGDDIGPITSLHSGYAQSKCAAEQLLKIAHSRGLPISIYRPSNIVGHSETGICSTSNFISLMIKGCIEMSIAPDIDAVLNLVPVDYVSRAIVYLSCQQKPCGQDFNLINSQSIEWKNLVRWMQRIGYSIEQVPYQTWHAELLNQRKQGSENILVSLASIFSNQNFLKSLLGGFNFDAKNTIKILASHDIVCHPVDEDLLNTYFSYFIHSGFLPAPTSVGQLEQSSLSNPLKPDLIRF